MIKRYSVEEVLQVGIELPPAIVLGAGNTYSNGISEGSVINAQAAAGLIRSGQLTKELLVTTGLGPDTEASYDVSEARGMAEVIWGIAGGDVNIEMDEESHDTIANVEGVKRILRSYDIGAISVFGAVHHTTRFKRIAGLHNLLVDITEVQTVTSVSKKNKVREIGQDLLYRGLTLGLNPGDDSVESREAMYRSIVAPAKKFLMNSSSGCYNSSAQELS